MAAPKIFTLGPCSINGTFFGGGSGYAVDAGLDIIYEATGGNVTPTYGSIDGAEPKIQLKTPDVGTILGITGATGVALSSTGFIAYLKQRASGGVFTSGSTHAKYTIISGMAYPMRVSARRNKAAELMTDIVALYDDTNAPLAIAKNQALPATAADLAAKYYAGPAQFTSGQSDIDIDVQDIEIDFGLNYELEYKNGLAYPSFCGVGPKRYTPMFSITTFDADIVEALTAVGKGGLTDVTAFLRKGSPNSTRVAEATAEHIQFVLPEAHAHCPNIDIAQDTNTPFKIEFRATWDGTNDAMTVDTTAAIAA